MENQIKQNKITVIIPIYNSVDTIHRTIYSVLNQTKLDLIEEIIIIDDGSTDDSLNVVKNIEKSNSDLNFKIISQKNLGVSNARNAGIKVATCEWIALLDSDDTWFPNKIEYQWNLIKNNSDIDFLGGNWSRGDFKILTRKITKLYKASVTDLLIKNFPQPSTAVFKREIFKTIGGFDERQRYAEDGNYFLKICGYYNFYFDPKQVISYGNGKKGFGESGLSKNIKKMHMGNQKNLQDIKKLKLINEWQYLCFTIFFKLKYLRRLAIVKLVK